MDDVKNALTLQEIVVAAKKRMAPAAWDFLSGGGESETTLKRNRWSLDSIAFRPRVLISVPDPDPSTTFLNHKIRIPVICAPVGSLHLMDPNGNLPVVRAMDRFGSMAAISIMSNPRLEDCAAETKGCKIFQLYVRGDWDWVRKTLDRVTAAGFDSLVITVDTAHYGRRERDLYNRFLRRATAQRANLEGIDLDGEWKYRGTLTWDFVEACKKHCGLPVMVKGIATREDAEIALQRGIDVIWVSNHGGRQMDHGRGAMACLPEIAAVAKGKVPIVIDGGFLRGTDVLKAIGLGADVVAIGKLQGWALAAGGEDGLVRCFEILETEMKINMGLLGVNKLAEITPAHFFHGAQVMNEPSIVSPYPVVTEAFRRWDSGSY
ncbi:MAG: alpha-hydroxy acid oxidase [Alphaproteobacteria bacterium]